MPQLEPGGKCPKCPNGKFSKKPKYRPAGTNKKYTSPRESGQLPTEALEYSCEDCEWCFYVKCPEVKREDSETL